MTAKLPTNILVPTDFSATAEYALDYAVALAAKLGAKIHLLNAISLPGLGVPELGVALSASVIDSLLRDNQAVLDKLVETRRSQVTFGDTMLLTGDARDVILRSAEQIGADLIVMGTHGRRGVSRMLLGSVAEATVRRAPCAVLTVRPLA